MGIIMRFLLFFSLMMAFSLQAKNIERNPDTYLEKSVPKYALNDILSSTIKQGLESREAVISLHHSYLAILDAMVQMSPRLRLTVTGDIGTFGVNIASSLVGLFGIFVPSNWFQLGGNFHHYESEKMALLSVIFNQYHLAKNSYLKMYQLRKDIAIYRLFTERLQKLLKLLKKKKMKTIEDRNEMQILQSLFYEMRESGFEITQLYNQLIPNLMTVMALSTDLYMVDFQYAPLEEIDMPLPFLYDSLKQFVIEGSYEVRSLEALVLERKALFWNRSLSFISMDEALQIDLGPHILTGAFLAHNEIKQIKVLLQKARLNVAKELRLAMTLYHTSLQKCRLSLKGAKYNENIFHKRYKGLISGKNPSSEGFLHLIEFGINHELALNACYFDMYVAESNIHRLIRYEAPHILELISENKKYKSVQKILKKEITLYPSMVRSGAIESPLENAIREKI